VLREHKADLVVLDLRMPATDGLTCCAASAPKASTHRP
jgi:CheY-like chemotaxis protein